MLIFLKSPIKSAKVGQKEEFFPIRSKVIAFEILTFDFVLEEKR